MPTNLTVRRAVARQPSGSFLFPLVALPVLIAMALGSVLLFPISDRSGMEDPTPLTVAGITFPP
jgi:hypothetical protein